MEQFTRVGIADCHGIESYKPTEPMTEDGSVNIQGGLALELRANSNRQRHAVLYIAEVDLQTDQIIQIHLKGGRWEEALEILKAQAISISFPDANPGYAKSWDLIPNPKLDPWG